MSRIFKDMENTSQLEISLEKGLFRVAIADSLIPTPWGANLLELTEETAFLSESLQGEQLFNLSEDEMKILSSAAEIAAQNARSPYPQTGEKGKPLVSCIVEPGAFRVKAMSATQCCNLHFYPDMWATKERAFSVPPEALLIAASWNCHVVFSVPEEGTLIISSWDLSKSCVCLMQDFDEIQIPEFGVHQETTGVSNSELREYITHAGVKPSSWAHSGSSPSLEYLCGLKLKGSSPLFMTQKKDLGGSGFYQFLHPEWKSWEKLPSERDKRSSWLNGVTLIRLLERMPDNLTLDFIQGIPGIKLSSLCHEWYILGTTQRTEDLPPMYVGEYPIYSELDSLLYNRDYPVNTLLSSLSGEPFASVTNTALGKIQDTLINASNRLRMKDKEGNPLVPDGKKAANSYGRLAATINALYQSLDWLEGLPRLFQEPIYTSREDFASEVRPLIDFLRKADKEAIASPEELKRSIAIAGDLKARLMGYPLIYQHCFFPSEEVSEFELREAEKRLKQEAKELREAKQAIAESTF
jgi:hypothetical protein